MKDEMQDKIQFLKEKIRDYEKLLEIAPYPERVESILDAYKKELRSLDAENIKNWS